MPGATEWYGIAFFDYGDTLSDPLNVRLEIDRFTLIDRQLYAMASVFGNGIISGWEVTSSTGLSVDIAPGLGIIDALAAETSFADSLLNLPPNSTLFIYAIKNAATIEDRSITFKYSTTELSSGLLLSKVVTGGINVSSVDNTVRTDVGFKQIIADEIAQHRHNGSSPKIDLTEEVQGLLPTSRIDNFDASKLTGRLPSQVLGQIDHNDLKNIGSLSHPQIDSMLMAIEKDNIALLGEVTAINLLKMICQKKYIDPDFDRYMINEVAIIPGISDDSLIDFENTNAYLDFDSNCISGIPELPEELQSTQTDIDEYESNQFQIISVKWDTDEDFKNATSLTNVIVSNGVKLTFDSVFDKIVDKFDEGTIGGTITNYVGTLTETNTTAAYYDPSAVQGPLSARFQTNNSRSVKYVKTYTGTQDWSDYDTLVVFVKNYSATHSSVTLALYDGDGNALQQFLLLDTDEVTTITNPDTNGFQKKEFDLSGFVKSKIGRIELFTESINNESEIFYVDTIYLKSSQFLLPSGNMRLRYNTSAPVIFNAVDYTASIPSGTDLRVRVRTGNSLVELANATFTSLLNPGETFSIPGTNIEIDITFLSDATKQKTPLLSSVELKLLAPSDESGLSIASATSWRKSTSLKNIDISDSGIVSMLNTNVGNISFINQNQVNELDVDLLPVLGISSQNMPIAPAQANNFLFPVSLADDPYGEDRHDTRGLYNPRSAYRLVSGNYLIADTGNDRVMEIDQSGVFVRGWGSHNTDYSDNLYGLSSCYNPRLGVLFITFSNRFDIQNFDLSKIYVFIGTSRVLHLSNDSDKIRTLKGDLTPPRVAGATSGLLDRTISILLSKDKRDLIETTQQFVTVKILTDASSSLSNTSGLECFIGDFMYFGVNGISSPIYANISDDTKVLICNAAITSASTTITACPSVIEFDTTVGELLEGQSTPVGLTFQFSDIVFSDIMLGSAEVRQTQTVDGDIERKVLIAGLQKISGKPSTTEVLPVLDDKKMQLFKGVIQQIDMDSGLSSFNYISPDGMYPSDAYTNESGYIVAAESTFTEQSGRIITIDPSGIGEGQQPPIIRLIEGGMFTKIWDIRNLDNDHIFVST